MKMSRRYTKDIGDWETRKNQLIRNYFLDLSPILENDQPTPDDPPLGSSTGVEDSRSHSPLPDLIIEREPKRYLHDQPEEFYDKLKIKVRKYMARLERGEPSDFDSDLSSTEYVENNENVNKSNSEEDPVSTVNSNIWLEQFNDALSPQGSEISDDYVKDISEEIVGDEVHRSGEAGNKQNIYTENEEYETQEVEVMRGNVTQQSSAHDSFVENPTEPENPSTDFNIDLQMRRTFSLPQQETEEKVDNISTLLAEYHYENAMSGVLISSTPISYMKDSKTCNKRVISRDYTNRDCESTPPKYRRVRTKTACTQTSEVTEQTGSEIQWDDIKHMYKGKLKLYKICHKLTLCQNCVKNTSTTNKEVVNDNKQHSKEVGQKQDITIKPTDCKKNTLNTNIELVFDKKRHSKEVGEEHNISIEPMKYEKQEREIEMMRGHIFTTQRNSAHDSIRENTTEVEKTSTDSVFNPQLHNKPFSLSPQESVEISGSFTSLADENAMSGVLRSSTPISKRNIIEGSNTRYKIATPRDGTNREYESTSSGSEMDWDDFINLIQSYEGYKKIYRVSK